MKEGYIVNESEPATFSTLRKNERTAMSKTVEVVAFLCSTYNVDFKAVVENHKFGVREGLSLKVKLLLANPPYSLRMDRDDPHAKYNVLKSNDIKEMVKTLEDVMKLGVHVNVFCYALHFTVL